MNEPGIMLKSLGFMIAGQINRRKTNALTAVYLTKAFSGNLEIADSWICLRTCASFLVHKEDEQKQISKKNWPLYCNSDVAVISKIAKVIQN